MSPYAENTSVSVASSKAEIESILLRYDADEFVAGWQKKGIAMVSFGMGGRSVRFILPLPKRDDHEFTHTPGRDTERSPSKALAAYEKACRQRWRALTLVIKAKLEAVETGITTFEEEFLAHIVMANGSTIGERLIPQLDQVKGARAGLLPFLENSP